MPEVDDPGMHEFARMANNREQAQSIYRRTKALIRLDKLNNSKSREPLAKFELGDQVKCWRKFKGVKSRWCATGRVVLNETLPELGEPMVWPTPSLHRRRQSGGSGEANPKKETNQSRLLPDHEYTATR